VNPVPAAVTAFSARLVELGWVSDLLVDGSLATDDDEVRAAARAERVVSPRLRTGWIAGRDAQRTTRAARLDTTASH
jgi:hypothetical protein